MTEHTFAGVRSAAPTAVSVHISPWCSSSRTGPVGAVAKRGPLLVDRRQPPAGDLGTVDTRGEDHVERVLGSHPHTAQLLISTQAAE
jgi:hypothetical protein